MDLKEIFSVSGKPGLYKLLNHNKIGAIVESLTDGKRMQIFASDRASSLKDIAIFTENEDVSLAEVLQNIFKIEEGKSVEINVNDAVVLCAFMDKVLPEWDKERVHISDLKKLVVWYNLLLSKELIDLKEEENEDRSTEIENS
ncbi:hypothetical protein FACS1894180_0640 [Bacteroidia bacterium]|nr:hypothetical protein FACS1894178_7740 [Bacteroidia bacterium]GHV42946.1 hypothetical protein FACS1894180_0640 [Bacteroidia bacterium]